MKVLLSPFAPICTQAAALPLVPRGVQAAQKHVQTVYKASSESSGQDKHKGCSLRKFLINPLHSAGRCNHYIYHYTPIFPPHTKYIPVVKLDASEPCCCSNCCNFALFSASSVASFSIFGWRACQVSVALCWLNSVSVSATACSSLCNYMTKEYIFQGDLNLWIHPSHIFIV